jgi:hypothetical protein
MRIPIYFIDERLDYEWREQSHTKLINLWENATKLMKVNQHLMLLKFAPVLPIGPPRAKITCFL